MKRFLSPIAPAAVFGLLITLAAAPAAAQKAAPAVRVGLPGISGSNAYPYVSKQLGLFAKYNVEVDVVVFQAGIQVVQAMLAGDLPLGIVDGPPGLAANLRGGSPVVIAGNGNRKSGGEGKSGDFGGR